MLMRQSFTLSWLKHAGKCFPLIFLTYSCQVGAPYEPPCPNTPDQWKNETAEQKQAALREDVCKALGNWWEIFDDPVLNRLEEEALQSSYTLQSALARVVQAQELARVALADLYPNITFEPSYSDREALVKAQGAAGGALSTQNNQQPNISTTSSTVNPNNQQQPSIPSLIRVRQTRYRLPLVLNYDLDLWSRLLNTYLSDVYTAEATFEDYLNTLLSLTSEIATNYFILRGLDAEQVVLKKNIKARQDALDVNQARYDAGLILYVDVTRAQLEVATARADSIEVDRQRSLQEDLLATLVGTPAPVFDVKFNPLKVPPPVIPAGIPSDLLLRRPDIAAAERNMAAAHAQIGVAYASFFPAVQLTAALGFESPELGSLLKWKARLWEIAVNVVQTVFDAGRNTANLRYAKAFYSQTVADYQQEVLSAFQEVEDALANIRQYAARSEELALAVKAATETLSLVQMRYDRGLINYLDVVEAERSTLDSERSFVINLSLRYQSTVQLIQSLGGSWQPTNQSENENDEAQPEVCSCDN